MFPLENRLRKTYQIDQVFKAGKKLYSDNFMLYYKKNNIDKNRYTYIISKKQEKSAVKRNRLKRRIIELFRKEVDPLIKNYDIVIIGKSFSETVSHKKLLQEAKKLVETLK